MYNIGDKVKTTYGIATIQDINLGEDTKIWITITTQTDTYTILGTEIIDLYLNR